jgi:hypothetical protein
MKCGQSVATAVDSITDLIGLLSRVSALVHHFLCDLTVAIPPIALDRPDAIDVSFSSLLSRSADSNADQPKSDDTI